MENVRARAAARLAAEGVAGAEIVARHGGTCNVVGNGAVVEITSADETRVDAMFRELAARSECKIFVELGLTLRGYVAAVANDACYRLRMQSANESYGPEFWDAIARSKQLYCLSTVVKPADVARAVLALAASRARSANINMEYLSYTDTNSVCDALVRNVSIRRIDVSAPTERARRLVVESVVPRTCFFESRFPEWLAERADQIEKNRAALLAMAWTFPYELNNRIWKMLDGRFVT